MSKRICVEISGVFYESLICARRKMKCRGGTVKRKCLSNKFPNYKIVPFRITYTEKECATCGISKSLKKFYIDNSCKDGLSPTCKECRKIYGKEWRENNSEQCKKYQKEWHENNPTYQKTMIADQRLRLEKIKEEKKEGKQI